MLCKFILFIKAFIMTYYFFWFQATGSFYNVNIMLIKKFCQALVISYHLIATYKPGVTIILATLVGKKMFYCLPKFSVSHYTIFLILEKYLFIDFLRIKTHLLRSFLYSFSLTSEGFLIYLFFSLLLV